MTHYLLPTPHQGQGQGQGRDWYIMSLISTIISIPSIALGVRNKANTKGDIYWDDEEGGSIKKPRPLTYEQPTTNNQQPTTNSKQWTILLISNQRRTITPLRFVGIRHYDIVERENTKQNKHDHKLVDYHLSITSTNNIYDY